MKKLIITIIFAIGLGMSLNAQNDGFFTSSYSEYRTENNYGNLPMLPGSHGFDYDVSADSVPVGSGLLLLGGLALGYAVRRRRD